MERETTTGEVAPPLILEVDDDSGIATLTLNRPHALNALSRDLAEALSDACAQIANTPAIRAVVVTGAGTRAFCAGADLKERRLLAAEERARHTRAIEAAAEALAAVPPPTIAAIRGYALAGGAELALACDLRVAGSDAMLGLPEVKIGIFPGAGGVLRLPALVGEGVARDLLFTGRQIAAAEALRVGLIERMTEPDDVLETARELAVAIAANAPLAVHAVKRALNESRGRPLQEARRVVNALRAELDDTADYAEGLAAFAEKRAPRFSGT
jgi:enoyl-CoA hydratase/carnithine racemase